MFAEFDKVINCLALELPEEVHVDVVSRYNKLKQEVLNKDKLVDSRTGVINHLNKALEADREAVSKLFLNRVPCNSKLQASETIFVDENCNLSVLGLISGMFGLAYNGMGSICAVVDNGSVLCFKDSEQKG